MGSLKQLSTSSSSLSLSSKISLFVDCLAFCHHCMLWVRMANYFPVPLSGIFSWDVGMDTAAGTDKDFFTSSLGVVIDLCFSSPLYV